MNAVEVSIIIVNYNTFRITLNCIQSIRHYVKSVSYEIILVDNGSTEVSADEFLNQDPSIRLVKNTTNVGFAKGNNLGLDYASGNYVLLLNSDTILRNDAIAIVKNFLDNHLHVAVATCRLEYPNEGLQHNCQRFPSIKYQMVELLRLQKIFPKLRQELFGSFFTYDQVAYPDWVWGTFFMFSRSLLEKLPQKKLADDFFMYAEDMQWCMEFRRLGYKTGFCPDASLIHFMGGSGGNKIGFIKANEDLFMKLYYPFWSRLTIRILKRILNFKYAS